MLTYLGYGSNTKMTASYFLVGYTNRPLPNSPFRSIVSRFFSMTSSFLASKSSTSQLADIYRPLKNRACGEAKYTAAPAASSTLSPKISYVSVIVEFDKESEIGDGSKTNVPVSSQKWRASG